MLTNEYAKDWLYKLKNYWLNKDIENVIKLFKKTTYYQETPFVNPFTTLEEIKKEWEGIKGQDIKKIEMNILAIENNTLIVNWIFERDIHKFNGIYEIRFNDNLECIYFKSWEMEK